MANVRLILAYDGSAYLGWQDSQTGPSIEAALRLALEQILQQPLQLQAASRTDAGVHADGQVVNFLCEKAPTDLDRLRYGVNCLLPPDIRVLEASLMPDAFHPTLDATGKTYRYTVCWGAVQHPKQRCYAWHFPRNLDLDSMRAAAKLLVGTHNFRAFCNQKKNEGYDDHTRTVTDIQIRELPGDSLELVVSGKSFLYKMVRNIVGTLLYVGSGKMLAEDVQTLLQDGARTEGAITAPAHGLTLSSVLY
ncbi:MAG: tRNA pseudouridine(38-40) synthase TruA [Chlamydiia bacterium]|nr:tRNA pseudouridine(38-40) synthase TruA [Chlamydiia bacterium]